MLNLMRLELKRNNLRTYQLATVFIFFLVLGFTYLFAYVPQFNPDDTDLLLFSGYANVFSLSILICMAIFCILSSVMYARFIIDEYAGKRAALLFSYPVDRRRVLLAKILVVFLFNFVAMIVCSVFALGIFSLTEQFAPMITSETLSASTLVAAAKNLLIMAIVAPALSVVAAGLGFIQKSVPTTIISAVVMVSVLGNFMSGALQNATFALVLLGISLVAAILTSGILMIRVNTMEVA